MRFERLKEIADKDSILLDLNPDTGIVKVTFMYLGCSMNAQYGATVPGIYAFGIDDDSVTKFFELQEQDKS